MSEKQPFDQQSTQPFVYPFQQHATGATEMSLEQIQRMLREASGEDAARSEEATHDGDTQTAIDAAQENAPTSFTSLEQLAQGPVEQPDQDHPDTIEESDPAREAEIRKSVEDSCRAIAKIPLTQFTMVAGHIDADPFANLGDNRDKLVNAWLDAASARAYPENPARQQELRLMLEAQINTYFDAREELQELMAEANEYASHNVTTENVLPDFLASETEEVDYDKLIAEFEAKQAQAAAEAAGEQSGEVSIDALRQADTEAAPVQEIVLAGEPAILAFLEDPPEQLPQNTPVVTEIADAVQGEAPEITPIASIAKAIHEADSPQALQDLLKNPPVLRTEQDATHLARYLYALFNFESVDRFVNRYASLYSQRPELIDQVEHRFMVMIAADRYIDITSMANLADMTEDEDLRAEKPEEVAILSTRLHAIAAKERIYFAKQRDSINALLSLATRVDTQRVPLAEQTGAPLRKAS